MQQNLCNSDAISGVAARWRGAMGSLRGLGIAHNDLQHGNVMVQADNRLHLVDYDGIFLPSFRGESSPEIGHKNYQHPQRSANNYDAQIDNFPALVVYLSLLGLRADPNLWKRFYNEDNLLLTQKDYENPKGSQCLQALRQSRDETVSGLALQLERYCSLPVEQVPDLESIIRGDARPHPSQVASTAPITSAHPNEYEARLQSQLVQAIKQRQPAPVPPPPAAILSKYIRCPQCGQDNNVRLEYFARDSCQAHLRPITRNQSQPAPVQPKPPPAKKRIKCPQCGQDNSVRLKYCARNSCQAELRPTTRNQSQPAPVPPPATTLSKYIQCPKCRLSNSADLIYCVSCLTTLLTTTRRCVCGFSIPSNARFCSRCRRRQS